MQKPKIADKKPMAAPVKKGEEYYWCACGESKNQPFCDGSHASTPFKPLAFTAEKDEDAYLCMCKQSKNPPFCDGTHATLKEEKQENNSKSTPSTGSTTEEPTLA